MSYEIFRRNIVKIRSSQSLSGRELSEKANLKQKKRINDIEEGRGTPSLDEVCSICRTLGYNIDDMLYKEASVIITFKKSDK